MVCYYLPPVQLKTRLSLRPGTRGYLIRAQNNSFLLHTQAAYYLDTFLDVVRRSHQKFWVFEGISTEMNGLVRLTFIFSKHLGHVFEAAFAWQLDLMFTLIFAAELGINLYCHWFRLAALRSRNAKCEMYLLSPVSRFPVAALRSRNA